MANNVSGSPVRFIAGSNVTTTNPPVVVGQVVYDTATSVLYIDTESGRQMVTDPTVLTKQDKVYIQDTEPVNAPIGSIWIDTSTTTVIAEEMSF